jgi:hypothetical protein
MKKPLQKRITTYSKLTGTFLTMAGAANAQVVYTDVVPDQILNVNGQTFMLDLNSDLQTDFMIRYFHSASTSYDAKAAILYIGNTSNAVGATSSLFGTTSYEFAQALSGSNYIGPVVQQWTGESTMLMAAKIQDSSNTYSAGPWIGATDKYLPLLMTISGQPHYGWVRLDVNASITQITVKDYAFNNTPHVALHASTSVGLDENSNELPVTIWSNSSTIHLNFENILGAKHIMVLDVSGRVVQQSTSQNQTEQLNISEASAGIYFVKVATDEGTVTKKVVLK